MLSRVSTEGYETSRAVDRQGIRAPEISFRKIGPMDFGYMKLHKHNKRLGVAEMSRQEFGSEGKIEPTANAVHDENGQVPSIRAAKIRIRVKDFHYRADLPGPSTSTARGQPPPPKFLPESLEPAWILYSTSITQRLTEIRTIQVSKYKS